MRRVCALVLVQRRVCALAFVRLRSATPRRRDGTSDRQSLFPRSLVPNSVSGITLMNVTMRLNNFQTRIFNGSGGAGFLLLEIFWG